MIENVLFPCAKCFSMHLFEELSAGTQLCRSCRGSTSVVECSYCCSEFLANSVNFLNICESCEDNLSKYGQPAVCECCKIVAAFGGSKCMRCVSEESIYGPPVQCEECKLRMAFNTRIENRKINSKLLCRVCTCAYERAEQEGRISSKKRTHENTQCDRSSVPAKKRSLSDFAESGCSNRSVGLSSINVASFDMAELLRTGPSVSVAPAVISIDQVCDDPVFAMANLKKQISLIEKCLTPRNAFLGEEKLLTEIKQTKIENDYVIHNKINEIDRINEMKLDHVVTLFKKIIVLKESNRSSNGKSSVILAKHQEVRERENISSNGEITVASTGMEPSHKDDNENANL